MATLRVRWTLTRPEYRHSPGTEIAPIALVTPYGLIPFDTGCKCMVEAADNGIIGTRDCALVLLGFAGAFRRSEQTEQFGQGRKIGITMAMFRLQGCPESTSRALLKG